MFLFKVGYWCCLQLILFDDVLDFQWQQISLTLYSSPITGTIRPPKLPYSSLPVRTASRPVQVSTAVHCCSRATIVLTLVLNWWSVLKVNPQHSGWNSINLDLLDLCHRALVCIQFFLVLLRLSFSGYPISLTTRLTELSHLNSLWAVFAYPNTVATPPALAPACISSGAVDGEEYTCRLLHGVTDECSDWRSANTSHLNCWHYVITGS